MNGRLVLIHITTKWGSSLSSRGTVQHYHPGEAGGGGGVCSTYDGDVVGGGVGYQEKEIL